MAVELGQKLCGCGVFRAGEAVEFGCAVFESVDHLKFELDEHVLLGGEGLRAAALGCDEAFDGRRSERVIQPVEARDFGECVSGSGRFRLWF